MALRHLIRKIELSDKLHPLEKALAEVRVRSLAMNPRRRRLYAYNKTQRSIFTALQWTPNREYNIYKDDPDFIPVEYWKHLHACTKDVYVEDAYVENGEIYIGNKY